eukprot:54712-Prymnesium_polylepis.2
MSAAPARCSASARCSVSPKSDASSATRAAVGAAGSSRSCAQAQRKSSTACFEGADRSSASGVRSMARESLVHTCSRNIFTARGHTK